jgi:hypothetical protein
MRFMRKKPVGPTPQELRALDALNLFRQGKAKSASDAARKAGTTLEALWHWVPLALEKNPRSGRVSIRPTDPYSAKVQIVTNDGTVIATARGSRQRELAGQHRATFMRVLRNEESPAALEKYRETKVGGHELISDYARLTTLAQAGLLGQLETLYVSPDVSA